jgi:hypothetical protein
MIWDIIYLHDFHESAILGSTTNGTSGMIFLNASSIAAFTVART